MPTQAWAWHPAAVLARRKISTRSPEFLPRYPPEGRMWIHPTGFLLGLSRLRLRRMIDNPIPLGQTQARFKSLSVTAMIALGAWLEANHS